MIKFEKMVNTDIEITSNIEDIPFTVKSGKRYIGSSKTVRTRN
jgi:hypothetical protein